MKKSQESDETEINWVEDAYRRQDANVAITWFLQARGGNNGDRGDGDGPIAKLGGAFKAKVEALMSTDLTEENIPAELKVD